MTQKRIILSCCGLLLATLGLWLLITNIVNSHSAAEAPAVAQAADATLLPAGQPVTQTLAVEAKPALAGGALVETPRFTQSPQRAMRTLGVSAAPVITLWAGNNQTFGQLGNPQRWINLLGNVSDSANVATLVYSLNGAPAQPLSIGPDDQRLADAGDFNIELDRTTLPSGANQVVITATTGGGEQSSQVVTVNHVMGQVWPLPYLANWQTATTIASVAQVVDGRWVLEAGRLRPLQFNYDRLVAFGDVDPSWGSYEVTVPFTIYAIDQEGFNAPSNGPGVGVIIRWQGHTQVASEQPRVQWRQSLGGLGWFRWRRVSPGVFTSGLQLLGYNGKLLGESTKTPQFDTPYLLKLRVEPVANAGDNYFLKVWEASQPEPAGWDISGVGRNDEVTSGSVVLVAHHADVVFGNVTVTPLNQPRLTLAVNAVGGGTVQVQPAQTDYAFGETITLTANPPTGYTFTGWSGALNGTANPATLILTANATVTANFAPNQYSLSTSVVGNGAINLQPPGGIYSHGQTITLTAVAATGWTFSGWGGALSGSANPAVLVMTGNQNVSATFGEATPTPTATVTETPTPTNTVPPGSTSTATATATDTATPTAISTPTATATTTGQPGATATPTATSTATATSQADHTPTPTATATTTGQPGATATPTPSLTSEPTATVTATATPPEPLALHSDDFNDCTVAAERWQWSDPLGDSSFAILNHTQVAITVPGGVDHELWKSGLNAPRLMQQAQDLDFMLEVKFESPVTQPYQLQGVLVEGDEATRLRLNFQWDDNFKKPIFFVGTQTASAGWKQQAKVVMVDLPPPYFLQIVRTGDQWTVQYGFDGINWSKGTQFAQPMTVQQVGIFAGNAGEKEKAAPAHTAVIDYFFNAAAPITPEDGKAMLLPVSTVGEGEVILNPPCGNPVEVTAVPAEGWSFAGWSGALTGQANPATLAFAPGAVLTATFALATSHSLTFVTTPGGQVMADPPGPTYTPGQVVTLTAVPDDGWDFARWEVEGEASATADGESSPTIEVIIPDERLYRAIFVQASANPPNTLYLPVIGNP